MEHLHQCMALWQIHYSLILASPGPSWCSCSVLDWSAKDAQLPWNKLLINFNSLYLKTSKCIRSQILPDQFTKLMVSSQCLFLCIYNKITPFPSIPICPWTWASLFAQKTRQKRPSLLIDSGPEKKLKQVKGSRSSSSKLTPNTLSSGPGSHHSSYSSDSGRNVSKSSGPKDERHSSSDLSQTGEECMTNASKHTSGHLAGTKKTSNSDVEVVSVLKDATTALNK